MLSMDNPISTDNPLLCGFRRIRAGGVAPASEYVAPYGFVIPTGRCLVVTDLAFFSDITEPLPEGSLSRVELGYWQPTKVGWNQATLFVVPALYTKNRCIGGNVSLNSGIVIPHARYLTARFHQRDLASTELFAYGYLADA